MSLLQDFRSLYSVETLDTRFKGSSTARDSEVEPSRQRQGKSANDVSTHTKWKTPEFTVYWVVFAIVVPWMFYTVYNVSLPSHPGYSKFESLLSDGWIFGRKVDDSDAQYSGFRKNVPYLFIVLILHPLLRQAYERLSVTGDAETSFTHELQNGFAGSATKNGSVTGQQRLRQRTSFDVVFNLLFLTALHGTSAPKIVLILCLNYLIATRLDRNLVPAATWTFNIAILFANELAQGYSYAKVFELLLPSAPNETNVLKEWASAVDSYGGLQPRWDVHFNVTVLRMISFNFDYIWARDRSGSSSPVEKKQLDRTNLSERDRITMPAQSQEYSFRNYFAYTLYSPLYLAGPILTFNDFISQQKFMSRGITLRQTIMYGIRFVLALLAMELMIHFIYVIAISKADPVWDIYTPFELSMLGFFNLHHIWLKLLLPWRFFRLWALVDQIDPPENVVRCMSDNYSALAFWRGWHRSYNRWIIRYIYIPLGGSGGPKTQGKWGTLRAIFNVFVIFSFVAIWHDIQLRLLVWGWLITLFILPEILAGLAFPKSKWQDQPETYRMICGVGAVGNILMMMSANLVGFAVGLDGLKGLISGIVGTYSGLIFLVAACGALFTGVQVMFEWRQDELRRGVNMRC